MGPMTTTMHALDELRSRLPAGVVLTEPEAMEKYRHDWSRNPPAGMPVAVVKVKQTTQEGDVILSGTAEVELPH